MLILLYFELTLGETLFDAFLELDLSSSLRRVFKAGYKSRHLLLQRQIMDHLKIILIIIVIKNIEKLSCQVHNHHRCLVVVIF